jgi:type I restriction enzyme, S subunit
MAGDLLLSIRGSVGTVAMVPKELRGANITQDIARVRLHPSVNARYVRHALTSSRVLQFLRDHTVGQAVRGVNIRDVRRIPLLLPPLAVQSRITDILDLWDRAIAGVNVLIGAKAKLKAGLLQHLLGAVTDSRVSARSWHCYHLRDLFHERCEVGRADLPLLAITADRGVIHRDELDRRDSSNEDKSAYLRIAPGDIGYNTMRMWQGVSALSSLEGIVSPAYTICVPGPLIDGAFAAAVFKLPAVVHRFRRYSQGLVDDTLNLKFRHFAQIRLRIPPIQEQHAIMRVLTPLSREIELLESLRDAYARQKRGLLNKLLTGEFRPTPE